LDKVENHFTLLNDFLNTLISYLGGNPLKIEFIPAYLKLEDYIQEEFHNSETWEKTMVEPYWSLISQWSPVPEDYKKPYVILIKMKQYNN
jgi:hypothetical protein